VTPVVLLSLLPLLFVARYVREVRLLPEAEYCTAWPGIECDRPDDKNFMLAMARGMAPDWGSQERPPHVYGVTPELILPFYRVKRARRVSDADYVVVWDGSYEDAEKGRLKQSVKKSLRGLGPELLTVRYHGQVVARVFRQPR
jgi:hypothetical protein